MGLGSVKPKADDGLIDPEDDLLPEQAEPEGDFSDSGSDQPHLEPDLVPPLVIEKFTPEQLNELISEMDAEVAAREAKREDHYALVDKVDEERSDDKHAERFMAMLTPYYDKRIEHAALVRSHYQKMLDLAEANDYGDKYEEQAGFAQFLNTYDATNDQLYAERIAEAVAQRPSNYELLTDEEKELVAQQGFDHERLLQGLYDVPLVPVLKDLEKRGENMDAHKQTIDYSSMHSDADATEGHEADELDPASTDEDPADNAADDALDEDMGVADGGDVDPTDEDLDEEGLDEDADIAVQDNQSATPPVNPAPSNKKKPNSTGAAFAGIGTPTSSGSSNSSNPASNVDDSVRQEYAAIGSAAQDMLEAQTQDLDDDDPPENTQGGGSALGGLAQALLGRSKKKGRQHLARRLLGSQVQMLQRGLNSQPILYKNYQGALSAYDTALADRLKMHPGFWNQVTTAQQAHGLQDPMEALRAAQKGEIRIGLYNSAELYKEVNNIASNDPNIASSYGKAREFQDAYVKNAKDITDRMSMLANHDIVNAEMVDKLAHLETRKPASPKYDINKAPGKKRKDNVTDLWKDHLEQMKKSLDKLREALERLMNLFRKF